MLLSLQIIDLEKLEEEGMKFLVIVIAVFGAIFLWVASAQAACPSSAQVRQALSNVEYDRLCNKGGERVYAGDRSGTIYRQEYQVGLSLDIPCSPGDRGCQRWYQMAKRDRESTQRHDLQRVRGDRQFYLAQERFGRQLTQDDRRYSLVQQRHDRQLTQDDRRHGLALRRQRQRELDATVRRLSGFTRMTTSVLRNLDRLGR